MVNPREWPDNSALVRDHHLFGNNYGNVNILIILNVKFNVQRRCMAT